MFKTRLLSGIVLVILALVFIITGNDLLLAVTGIISLIGLYELYRVFKIEKSCAGVVGGLATIVYYCNLKFQFIPDMMLFVIALLVVLMFVYVFSYPKYHTEQMLAAFFGVFYVSVMLSYVYQTRMLPGGAYIVWLIFLCSWGCDTCAYCVGVLIWKTQDGTGAFSEEILGRSCWRSSGSSIINPDLLLCFPGIYGKHQP